MYLILALMAVLSIVPPVPQSPAADEVLQREQQRVQWLVTGKFDDLAGMLSPTMTYTHSSGVLDSKEKFLDSLRSGRTVYKAMKHAELQVRLPTRDVAILNGISDVSVIVNGQPQEVPLRFTLVYVRTNAGWMMEAWHSARRPPA